MSGFQQKITKHTNKQKNTAHSQEKKHLTETIPEEVQNLELVAKDIKSSVLNMLNGLKETQ